MDHETWTNLKAKESFDWMMAQHTKVALTKESFMAKEWLFLMMAHD